MAAAYESTVASQLGSKLRTNILHFSEFNFAATMAPVLQQESQPELISPRVTVRVTPMVTPSHTPCLPAYFPTQLPKSFPPPPSLAYVFLCHPHQLTNLCTTASWVSSLLQQYLSPVAFSKPSNQQNISFISPGRTWDSLHVLPLRSQVCVIQQLKALLLDRAVSDDRTSQVDFTRPLFIHRFQNCLRELWSY